MSQAELSIVIPSYNCAQYLARSVASAFAFCSAPAEVLVVDDGSTDNTQEILSELAIRYPSMRVLAKPNGGLSSARNHGLDHATGRYVLFLDSDDELIPVGTLPAVLTEPDMIRFGVEELGEDGSVVHHVVDTGPQSGIAFLADAFAEQRFFTPSWAYLYDVGWLRNTGIRFVHGLIHEDMLFTVEALIACQRFAVLDALAYRYFRRAGSITTHADPARIRRRLDSLATIVRRLTVLANETPGADVGWWALNTIDYAESLALQVSTRALLWQVAMMEIRFFFTYRAWGKFRARSDVRYRVRQRIEKCLASGREQNGR